VPRSSKKFILLAGGLALLFLLQRGQWVSATGLAAALFAWLAVETRLRSRFRFTDGSGRETGIEIRDEVTDLRFDFSAVFIHAVGKLTLAPADAGRTWTRSFEVPPLAVLGLPQGRLIHAHEDHLSLTDAQGRDVRSLSFEAPLLRQGYRLLAASDGSCAALVTPWFVQVFDTELKALRGRIRYEDAGHYFKYAAMAPQGRGLLLAGAYLLDEEAGGALEARWDWWEPQAGWDWVRRWSRARESYENSQLRGVQVSSDGGVLCTELYRAGYEFAVQEPGGGTLWERRGGEKPVLSPGAGALAWENGPDELVLSRGRDGGEMWKWRHQELIRLKRPMDDGSCLVLEGRCLRSFNADGGQGPELWLKEDAQHVALGLRGGLALAAGRHGALLGPDWGR
jgi:hypothetical protein